MADGDGFAWSGGPGVLERYLSRGEGATNAALHGCSELNLTLGRDAASSGVSITVVTPSEGTYPHHRVLFAERWRNTLPGEEGIIETAIQALQACLGRIRGLQDPPA